MDFNAIFKSVQGKAAEAETTRSSNSHKDTMMSFTPGNEYLIRCVPYVNNEGEFKYFCKAAVYSWKDSSGRWWNITSPYSIGEKCPIMQYRNSFKEQHTESEIKKLDSVLQFRNATYFNALIVNDPVNPSNNNSLKIVNGGKELARIVTDAVNGKLDEEYARRASDAVGKEVHVSLGPNIFNLTDSGWNMLVKPLKGNPAVSYKASSFTRNKSKLGLSDKKMEEIVNSAYNLDEYFLSSIKSYEETAKFFQVHFDEEALLNDGYSSSHNYSNSSQVSEIDDLDAMLGDIPDSNKSNDIQQEDNLNAAFGEDNIPF